MAETEKTAAATTNTSTSDSTTSSHKSVDVDEAGVPMMTPLQKKLFELRRKGNEAKKRTRDQLIEEETKRSGKGVEGMSENQKQRLKKKMKMEKDPDGWFLDVTAEAAEKDFAKARKKRQGPDPEKFGWSAFDDNCQHRVYERRIRSAVAQSSKEQGRESTGKGGKDDGTIVDEVTGVTKEGVNRMVSELNRNIERRSQFSRPRPLTDEARDVDYISERNRKFNEKLNRHYDKYTEEIRASLERGSAF